MKQTTATTILVYSPDTDVYNIGLTTLNENKEVIVQVNVPQSTKEIYINLNKLISALQNDPDLATITRENLPKIFQMLYVCSGCDYISYSGSTMPGELLFSTADKIEKIFLSFLRLIGTLYFNILVQWYPYEEPKHHNSY